ncbi:MAG TPA: septum formation family protein [Nocardioides sp.]|uniref:septum formation family protein n=1 Tax=Nocardioides sp. TaxID=35761 RepID=UPI002EDA441E
MQTRLRAVVALSMLALGASLTLVPSGAQAAPAKPKMGTCHQLTVAQAEAAHETKPAIACTKRHNTWTFAVVQGPADLAAWNGDAYGRLGVLCQKPFERTLGGTALKRAQTAYALLWFTPTAEQLAAGQRWIRCDLALFTTKSLPSLPKLTRPVLSDGIAESERLCLTARGFATTCTTKHAYRSFSAFKVARVSYPTEQEFLALARARCRKGWDYVTWPGPITWSSGHRVLTCYDKTRR